MPTLRRGPLDESWRERAQGAQVQALPAASAVVSCTAAPGAGGLGRHVEEILDALDRAGQHASAISGASRGSEAAAARTPWDLLRLLGPAMRFSPPARVWSASVRFDAWAARRLPDAGHLIAFNGTALAQLRTAARVGFSQRSLVSANSHMRHVIRQHERAHRQHPVEQPWATPLLRRNLREYASAERIYVASDYIRDTFLERGVAEERLISFPLTPHPRFAPTPPPMRPTFDVVYGGSLLVHKGVPLLLDAFARLPYDDLRLTLVGGWKTRNMRRLVERACARDARIAVSPGDPLPHLRAARLCVHPAYEDGFAYAPAEALACGVPVLVSEDTGMKDLIGGERHGLVLPTGEAAALAEAIAAAYRGEIFDA